MTTKDDFTVTDAQLKRALDELAAGTDGVGLADAVMRVVDTTPQVRQSRWTFPRVTGRIAVLAATLLLLAALGGTVVLLSGVLPQPPPDGTPGSLQILPGRGEMTFVIPEGSDLEVSHIGSDPWWRFSGSGESLIEVLKAPIFVHPCPMPDSGESRVPVRATPGDAIEDLREIAGVGLSGVASGALGGYPAATAELVTSGGDCGGTDIHFRQGGLSGEGPSFDDRLGMVAVVDVDGTSIVLLITAPDDEWAAFEPFADAFLDSIEFEPAD